MRTRRSIWASPVFWWRAAIVLVCLLGLISGERRLIFFTTESNVIVFAYFSATLSFMLGRRTTDAPAPRLRGGVTLWIVTTGLISHVLLTHGANPFPGLVVADPAEALVNQSLFLMHYVVPVMVLVDWIVIGPHGLVRWRDGLLWLIYPVAYGLICIARAFLFPTVSDRFPYPFLNVDVLGAGVILSLLQVVVIIGVLAAGVIALDRLSALVARRLGRDRIGAVDNSDVTRVLVDNTDASPRP